MIPESFSLLIDHRNVVGWQEAREKLSLRTNHPEAIRLVESGCHARLKRRLRWVLVDEPPCRPIAEKPGSDRFHEVSNVIQRLHLGVVQFQ